MLELFDRRHQLAIMRDERQAGIDFACDQCLPDEQFARMDRVDFAEMNTAPGVDRQAIQGGALVGHHLSGFLFPARIGPGSPDQVRTGFFQPCGVDAGDAAGVQTGGFHQFGRDQPAPGFLGQARTRMNVEADIAGAQVGGAFFAFQADIAQQARQQRQMRLLIGGVQRIHAPALFARRWRPIGYARRAIRANAKATGSSGAARPPACAATPCARPVRHTSAIASG